MPRPKKTAEELIRMREQILDAAQNILETKGVEAITSRAIAEKMGIAHMSLFTYFPNHAAILDALREREMEKWRARQAGFVQRAQTEEIVGVIRELLESYVAFARENPSLFRLAWVMPEAIGESPEENRQRRQMSVETLTRIIKLGVERGVLHPRDPYTAAGVVLGMVNMPHLLYHTGKLTDPEMRDRMVDEVLAIAMRYLSQ
jgi:AcrR family transcriptional regulator